jgi:photosystem II stability/assembly factor-like uncharacterized protein
MKKFIVILLTILILFSFNTRTAKAGELQWINIAKWIDGNINSFAVDPSNINTLYFGTDAGSLYKSVDGGNSWTVINKFLYSIYSVTIDPANSYTIYLGLAGKVYKSSDGGLSWKAASNGLQNSSSSKYIVVLNSNKAIYALEKGYYNLPTMYPTFFNIYKSTDEGASWKKINISSVNSFVLDPKNLNIIYASLSGGYYTSLSTGIYKSTDGGNSWNLINNMNASSLAINPLSTNVLFAVANNGIFKSTDSGISWIQISYIKSSGNTWISIDPQNTSTVYFESLYDGIYKSPDSGSTWTKLSNLSANSITFDTNNTDTIYGIYGSSIFKSIDGGSSWKEMGNVSLLHNLYTGSFYSLALNPENPNVIFAGAWLYGSGGEGFYKSIDAGNSWSRIVGIDGSITCIGIDPLNSNTIYAGTSYSTTSKSLIKSTDGGNSWVNIDIGNLNPAVYSIAIDSVNSTNIYAGTDKGVFKSNDGGNSWQAINNGLKSKTARSISIDPKNNNTIYVGADDSDWYSVTSGSLYKSIDGGNTWVDVGGPIIKLSSAIFMTYVISFDPSNTNTVYAGTNKGLYKSIDSGSSWNKIADSSTSSIAIDQTDSKIIYLGTSNLGTSDSVFKSIDSGQTWQQVISIPNYNLDFHHPIHPIVINPSNTSIVYIGAGDNIFKQMTTFRITQTIAGVGSVTKSPNQELYPEGSIVAVGAVPQSGYAFINWSGDVSSSNPEIQIKINSDKNITATFKPSTTIKLQIGSAAFTVNDTMKYLDSPPVIKNGRTLIPIRAVIESLNGSVSWDQNSKKVTVSLGNTIIELWIGKSIAKVNGVSKPIDSTNSKVVPEIINGRTMLPLRFVTENLGATVDWNGTTQTITITYQGG